MCQNLSGQWQEMMYQSYLWTRLLILWLLVLLTCSRHVLDPLSLEGGHKVVRWRPRRTCWSSCLCQSKSRQSRGLQPRGNPHKRHFCGSFYFQIVEGSLASGLRLDSQLKVRLEVEEEDAGATEGNTRPAAVAGGYTKGRNVVSNSIPDSLYRRLSPLCFKIILFHLLEKWPKIKK